MYGYFDDIREDSYSPPPALWLQPVGAAENCSLPRAFPTRPTHRRGHGPQREADASDHARPPTLIYLRLY